MKGIHLLFLTGLLTVASCSMSIAQDAEAKSERVGQRVMKLDAGSALILQELSAVVSEKAGKIVFLLVPQKNQASAGIPDVDIAEGDEVGMINGIRIEKISELKDEYERTSIGSEIKLGIRRDGQPHLISFLKKNPKDMPQGSHMVIHTEKSGGDSDTFPALGIALRKKGSAVFISEKMPNAAEGLSQGDTIASLNGRKISSIDDFNRLLDETSVGAPLKFGLMRDGKPAHVIIPRPEPKRQIIMRKN